MCGAGCENGIRCREKEKGVSPQGETRKEEGGRKWSLQRKKESLTQQINSRSDESRVEIANAKEETLYAHMFGRKFLGIFFAGLSAQIG